MVSKFINEKFDEVEDKWIGFWRNSVWVTSAWLWWVWLSHDVANIAVYLPRQLDVNLLRLGNNPVKIDGKDIFNIISRNI